MSSTVRGEIIGSLGDIAGPDQYSSIPSAELYDPDAVPFGATYVENPDDPSKSGTVFKELRTAGMIALDVCIVEDGREVPYEMHFLDDYPDVAIRMVEGVKPGAGYNLRALGRGTYFNYDQRLVSPYALAVEGDIVRGHEGERIIPLCTVVDRQYDWEGLDRPTVTRKDGERIVYECNVRAATINLEAIDEAKRGTLPALAEDTFTDEILAQGVTTLELMPVQQFAKKEGFLIEREKQPGMEGIELENAWGYSTFAFNAPDSSLRCGDTPGEQVRQAKDTVKELHRKGIEVVMDVVYNHTAEDGLELISFNGLGWNIYKKSGNSTNNYSGCGPDTDMTNPDFLRYTMDSLEYWVTEMGVDGFRFDLTSTLAREGYYGEKVEPDGIFMQALTAKVKELEEKTGKPIFIAFEGWDIGHCDPYIFSQRGHSWSGFARDTIRKFARGDASIQDLATVLSGSFWKYLYSEYLPINFITAHDGFTQEDVVSYNVKNNERNGEKNADGTDDNVSFNYGHEGPTEDVEILNRRERAKRAMFSVLMFARGIPMILYGDELSRTQEGSNNAYCQKDLIATDWSELDDRQKAYRDFRIETARLRRESRTLQRTAPLGDSVTYVTGDGRYMSDDNWDHHRILGIYREGVTGPDTDEEDGESLLEYFNASTYAHKVRLPLLYGIEGEYELALDSGKGIVQNESALRFVTQTINTPEGKKRVIRAERRLVSTGQEIDIEQTSVIALRKVASRVNYGNGQATQEWQLGMHVSDLVPAHEDEQLLAA